MTQDTRHPDQYLREALEFGTRFARSAEALSRIREGDVDVGATPKSQVMQVEKVTLHHYARLDGAKPKTSPVLIVYGLIGRYTMADLQEDRSLVRNLLARGVDRAIGKPARGGQPPGLEPHADAVLLHAMAPSVGGLAHALHKGGPPEIPRLCVSTFGIRIARVAFASGKDPRFPVISLCRASTNPPLPAPSPALAPLTI